MKSECFQFSSVQFSLNTNWIPTPGAYSNSLSIVSMMPSNHLILYHPLLLPPSIFPSIRVFSKVSSSHQVAKVLEFQLQHKSFQWIFRLIPFRMDWLDVFAVQGTLKSLLQHPSSKASILQCSAFFIVQVLYPYMTTWKTIALTRWTFVGKVMSLLFNMLSRLVITYLPRSLQMAEKIIFILFKSLSLWYFVIATLQTE